MTFEEVQTQVTLFLGEIQEAITDDLLDVEFLVCESREAAVERLNQLLDPEDEKVTLDEIPVDAKGIFFGDSAETVETDDETTETIECAAGAIVMIACNLADVDEVDLVLLHEIGHALGLDEAAVDALGLGVEESETPEPSESQPTNDPKPEPPNEPQSAA